MLFDLWFSNNISYIIYGHISNTGTHQILYSLVRSINIKYFDFRKKCWYKTSFLRRLLRHNTVNQNWPCVASQCFVIIVNYNAICITYHDVEACVSLYYFAWKSHLFLPYHVLPPIWLGYIFRIAYTAPFSQTMCLIHVWVKFIHTILSTVVPIPQNMLGAISINLLIVFI